MTRLSIAQIAGTYCGTNVEGEKAYMAVAPLLRTHEHVVLDFADVELTSSSFFNEFFCRLTEEFGESILDSLSYASLKPRHQFVLDRTRDIAPA